MPKATLRAVAEDERASEKVPKTIVEAAEKSQRTLLAALRNRIAVALDVGVPAHAIAPLARQLREVDRAIRDLDQARDDVVAAAIAVADEPFDASVI